MASATNGSHSKNDLSWSGFLQNNWKIYRTTLIVNEETLEDKVNEAKILFRKKYETARQGDFSFKTCRRLRLSDESPMTIFVRAVINDKIIYKGFFMNWSSQPEKVRGKDDSLPILIVKSKSTDIKRIHDIIGQIFSSVMTPMSWNTYQLVELSTAFIKSCGEDVQGSADFEFYLPGLRNSGTIVLSSKVRHLATILRVYEHLSNRVIIVEENRPEWMDFYEAFLRHYFRTFQLDLRRAELKGISLPGVSAKCGGQLRVSTENQLFDALQIINSFLASYTIENIEDPCPSNCSDSD